MCELWAIAYDGISYESLILVFVFYLVCLQSFRGIFM